MCDQHEVVNSSSQAMQENEHTAQFKALQSSRILGNKLRVKKREDPYNMYHMYQ